MYKAGPKVCAWRKETRKPTPKWTLDHGKAKNRVNGGESNVSKESDERREWRREMGESNKGGLIKSDLCGIEESELKGLSGLMTPN